MHKSIWEEEQQRLFNNRRSPMLKERLKAQGAFVHDFEVPDGKKATPSKGGAWARWKARREAKKNKPTTGMMKD